MKASEIQYRVLVGLEIHVQLSTASKMFCSCAVEFAAEPNSRVCPVCLGLPGSLPVMNRSAFEYAVLTASALNCRIASFTKWDRKSYYYPDLPKNYQISQYDLPLGSDGYLEIPSENGKKKIGIIRVHLEEDAGKNIHADGGYSQVDLNRAGTALMEIVTQPQINSAAEARALAVELQRIVRYLGVSDADMQKGHMRFEPNVNLVITAGDAEYRTPITEIKNLNSFRSLERSVDYEIHRQLDLFLETGNVMEPGSKTTRGWDDAAGVTVLQREKEEAEDYRYFPDPDLLPVRVDGAMLESIRTDLCELPLARQDRYVSQYGLSDYDAGVLTSDRSTADFFEQALAAGGDPKRICNLVTQDLQKLANERDVGVEDLGIPTENVAKLAQMASDGQISATAASNLCAIMAESPDFDPMQLARDRNLIQQSDAGELAGIVENVLVENPAAVADVTGGGKKSKAARGFLLGQVMQATGGKANPKIVSQILGEKLKV